LLSPQAAGNTSRSNSRTVASFPLSSSPSGRGTSRSDRVRAGTRPDGSIPALTRRLRRLPSPGGRGRSGNDATVPEFEQARYTCRFMSGTKPLEVRNLKKQFGTVLALRGITFSVEPGEVFGYLGPNGAGKTTTLRIALGLVYPSSGEALMFGKPASNASARQKRSSPLR
jgi:ABC-type glutathione transport system ATPase component